MSRIIIHAYLDTKTPLYVITHSHIRTVHLNTAPKYTIIILALRQIRNHLSVLYK